DGRKKGLARDEGLNKRRPTWKSRMVFPGTIAALLVERRYDDASRLGSNHSPRASGRGGFRRSLRMGFSRRRRHASVGLADVVPRRLFTILVGCGLMALVFYSS